MGEKTTIAWCSHTFNPWWGCTKVSPGCDNCYAESIARRFHPGTWGVDGARRVWDDLADGAGKHWNEPLGWDKKARAVGVRKRVFCASMADVFDKHPAATDERPKLWSLIHKTPSLDWLLLTKRIGNVARMVPESWMRCGWPPNVWLGISVVNQEEVDRDVPKLLATPARVRFLSCEPLLGPIDLRMGGAAVPDYAPLRPLPRLDWVIVGGESGHGARYFDLQWAQSIVEQCSAVGVACFVKQLGAKPIESIPPSGAPDDGGDIRPLELRDRKGGDWTEWPEALRVREFPQA